MHSISADSDVATRAGALALTALFDPAMRKDRAVLGSIFEAAHAVSLQLFENLKLYLDDPIGVRGWPMSGPAFFGSSPPPVAEPVAIARIREARVAAAYGLRKSAIASLEMNLRMRPERMHQIAQALEVYERGVLASLAAQEEAEAPSDLAQPTKPAQALDDAFSEARSDLHVDAAVSEALAGDGPVLTSPSSDSGGCGGQAPVPAKSGRKKTSPAAPKKKASKKTSTEIPLKAKPKSPRAPR